ncbi:MAG: hypothetical protein ACK5AN_14420, partial [Planctomyces sp.]
VWRGATKGEPAKTLNIGIVSGSTVQMVIDALCDSKDWYQDFGVEPGTFGDVAVFALNVCLTQGNMLSCNANIITHRLSEKIREQMLKNKSSGRVKPYGLSESLVVVHEERYAVDNGSETRKIIEVTQPGRLKENPTDQDLAETSLHVVLTSVGSKDNSIFAQFKEQFREKNVHRLNNNRVKGDVLYTPINEIGDEVVIEDQKNKRVRMYSALGLEALETMANDKTKAVVLVARQEEKNDSKAEAIYAALFADHKYASMLILDEKTAMNLGRQAGVKF